MVTIDIISAGEVMGFKVHGDADEK